jgi:5'-3' exonuclease
MILAIDATNYSHVYYHAMQGSEPKQVAAAVARTVAAMMDHYKPSAVLACFDSPPSFRHGLVDNYKANRESKPGVAEVLGATRGALAHDCMICEAVGYEADDLLATAGRIGRECRRQVILATPDKDVRQCLADGWVTQLRSIKIRGGRVEAVFYRAKDLFDEYGLQPTQWADYQALVGDAGDNVAGCPSIGEKTAAAMLAKAGSLRAILANPWAVPGNKRQINALHAWKDKAAIALQLVTLVDTVDGVEDCLR